MRSDVSAQKLAVPFQVTNPGRIPAERYYDEEFYKLECERLWPHVWQMACRLEQIQNVGDWAEYTNIGRSVIIVRTKEGVRAYHNACRHRGVRLARGHGNCTASGFICPFHGWRWNIDGQNTFVYGKHLFDKEQLDQADLALPSCRIELWGGCAFINFDDNAPPLRECLGPVAANLEHYQADKMRMEWWYATVLPANWKIAMEAFMEGYHTMRTHPQMHEILPPMYNMMYGAPNIATPVIPNASVRENILAQINHMQVVCEGMAGMFHAKDVETARGLLDVPLPEDPHDAVMTWYGILNAEVTKQGRARGEPTPDLNANAVNHPVKAVEFLFPHYFLLPALSSMSSYRIRPLGPESCLFELWSLTLFPEGREPKPVLEPTMLPYDSDRFPPIPRQDYSNIPEQQIGLHTIGFNFMRLSRDVEGLISNYQRVIDGYLRGAPRNKLKEATAALGSNFDTPIRDVTF
jgi:nitrite reductase/ring-hydroxylating ferredoxin subunit